jgi:eukaryotic translation initiation factor 2C
MIPTLPPGLPQYSQNRQQQQQQLSSGFVSNLQMVQQTPPASIAQTTSATTTPTTNPNSNISSLVGGLNALAIDDTSVFTPPPRPSLGTEGKLIKLRANHFTIQLPKCFIYHYVVTIQPDKCPKRINRYFDF